MGRVVLIIGGVIGCIVVVLGVLFLILAVTQPDANQSDEIVGFGIFTGIGLVIAIPCLFFAYRMTPPVAAGMRFGAANLPPAAADAETRYLQWFTWCQQAIGGDPISLHAATMAALRAPDNPTAAASAEASRQASRIGASGPMPPPPNAAKVKVLARIGASTLGLLEPSERVLVSFLGTNRSRGAVAVGAAFGAIGAAVAASRSGAVFVTVTDRRVIGLIGGAYGGLANNVALIETRSTVSAKFPKGLFGQRTFTIKGMQGGSVSAAVTKPWRPEALIAIELLAPSAMTQIGLIR
ncbi:MAG: hypothetical protein E6I58_15175 [Chloroflexi bacterium]|nr:MAG: hypothetical protein E6I58_15175 [Chloroflexota bacterium]